MKLLLVDLDGTIREPISGGPFIQHPQDQRPMAGASQALAHFAQQGYKIAGISNQGGVAAGHKTLADAIAEQDYTLVLFPKIDSIFFCPDFEGLSCWHVGRDMPTLKLDFCTRDKARFADLVGTYRKPSPGMLLAAMRLYEPESTLYVGDREEDEKAAFAAEVTFLWAWDWRAACGGAV
jgi:D-glycero-D-manno-heptose 1,7-bisphosphate phosphatase